MTITKDFIVEIGTEELPPLSLETLACAFHDLLLAQVDASGLLHHQSFFYATPRRLAVVIQGLATTQTDKQIDRQGPTLKAAFDPQGNPTPAALGFAKSCGVNIDQLQKTNSPKGSRLAFKTSQKGQASADVLPALVQSALNKLPIVKAMRWGDHDYQFIRPVKWLLMLQGDEVIDANIFNCQSSNRTFGHRFHSSGEILLSSVDEYLPLLEKNFVIADIAKRKNIIEQQILSLAHNIGLTAVIDPPLLDEVTALVEWPVALLGEFDPDFLSVPQEALITTMANNQKYFHLLDDQQKLCAKFITIANIKSTDSNTIIEGNQRVIHPRLADAKFFFETDCKHSLSSLIPKLKGVVFQKQLGSLFDKTIRIQSLAKNIASLLSINITPVEVAAGLCKSDLLTNMVIEFPSLQGIMGRYYASNDGEDPDVAVALDEIYMPRFSGDKLPTTPTGLVLALADRLDTLIGIFAIGKRPTGNKDPYGLRRAALGILRILIEKKLSLNLTKLIDTTVNNYQNLAIDDDCIKHLKEFFDARLKAMYLDKGINNTVIQSVQCLSISEPLDFDARIKAVTLFNQLEQAQSLAISNKRVSNILRKNTSNHSLTTVDPALLTDPAEIDLFDAITLLSPKIKSLCQSQIYSDALLSLVDLKDVVDRFFDTVMVMDEDRSLRENRLALLHRLRSLFLAIADISYLQK